MIFLPNQQELQTLFSGFLFETGLSAVSIKNYLSDLRHFLGFCSSVSVHEDPPTVQEIFQNITKYLNLYITNQQKSFTPQNTINRRSASIRRFSTFLASKYGLKSGLNSLSVNSKEPTNANQQVEFNDDNSLPTVKRILDHFKNFLVKEKKSYSTVKNYISDLNHFFAWSANETPFLDQKLENILSESHLNAYITYLRLSHTSTSVINRRQSSIKQFTRYSFLQKYIPANPFEYKRETPRLLPLSWLERLSSKKNKGAKNASQSHLALWYQKYNSLPFTPYLHLAVLVLATSAMVIFGYNQIIKQAKTSSAALPTIPKRQLSFQGRLTDSSATPITTPVDVVFKLFNQLTGGSQLYTSSTCSVDPDQNGIFNSLIGDGTCGLEIDSTVFTNNRDVFLEISIGAETLTPRQQIATVGYALNSETLQGYPASGAATINTIPIVDNSGDINIAAPSPSINSTSGTFNINGQALTITTTANSGGNIVLQPDSIGGGQVQVLGSTTNTNSFHVQNANLTSGNLIAGYVGNDTASGRLLSLTAGSSEADRFSIATSGQSVINTGSSLANSGLIIIQNGTGDLFTASASSTTKFTIGNNGNITASGTLTGLTGLTVGSGTVSLPNGEINTAEISELDWTKLQNYPSACGAGEVVQAVGDTLTCVNVAAMSGNLWQRINGSLTPINFTDSLNLGTTDGATTSALVHLAGTVAENSFINTGNFGIGLTNPSTVLQVNGTVTTAGGNISFNNDSNFTTNINTGTSTGAVTVGGNSNTVAINSSNWDVSTAGAASGFTGISSSGNIDLSSLSAGGLVKAAVTTGRLGIASSGTDYELPLTFSNGLTRSTNAVALGGTLTGTTDIPLAGFDLTFSGLGNVGIGLTNPTAKLDVVGSVNIQGYATASGSLAVGYTNAPEGPGHAIFAGRLGVGLTNPAYNLDVVGDVNITGALRDNTSAGIAGQILSTTGTGVEWIDSPVSGTNYWQLNSGTVTPANITNSLNLGNAATASATVHLAGTSNENSFINTGYFGVGLTNPAYNLDVVGDVNITGALRDNTSAGIAGQILSTTGTGVEWIDAPTGSGSNWQRTSGSLAPLNITDSLNLGSTATTSALVHFGGTAAENSWINTGNFGIGDTTPAALFTVGSGDLFQVNSSGIIDKIDNVAHTIDDVSGNLTFTSAGTSVIIADDLGVNGATSADITSSTTTATVFDTTVTTLSMGGAATTLNLGTTDSITRAINLGTGNGIDTINIGTGGTGADVVNIGSANAGNVTIKSNAVLNLTGAANSLIDFPNFDVATTGNITTAGDIAVNGGDITTTGDLTINPAGGDVFLGASDNLGITAATNLIFGTTTSLGETTAANDSGAYLVGVFDEFDYSNGTNVQAVLNDLDAQLALSTNYWQLNSGTVTPANITNSLNLGNAATASATVHLAGTAGENSFINTGNFGIGTTTPSEKLTINGKFAFTQSPGDETNAGKIDYRGFDATALSVVGAGTGSNRLIRLYDYVGVNTAPVNGIALSLVGDANTSSTVYSAWGSSVLRFKQTTGDETNSGVISYRYTDGNALSLIGAGTSGTNRLVRIYDRLGINTAASSSQTLTVDGNGSTYAAIFTNGNVGIGITNPAYNLDVVGDVNITGTYLVNGSPLSSSNWQRTSGSLAPLNITDSLNLGSIATSSALIHLAGTTGENSWINTGKIGIGTTTPSQTFDVANFFTVDTTNSRVGIGTTTPTSTLEIAGASSVISNSSGDITFNSASNFFDFSSDSLKNFSDASSSGSLVFNSSNSTIDILNGNRLDFSTSPGGDAGLTSKMTLTNRGYLGIGLTNPTAALEIAGDILPHDTVTYNLGSASLPWLGAYMGSLFDTAGVETISLSNHYLANGNWYVQSGGLKINTDSAFTAAELANNIKLYVNGNATISGTFSTGGDLNVNEGNGKINVGTIDPPYTINGEKYATYVASMVGVKEEITGNITTTENNYIEGLGFRTLIDLDQQPTGSDIWLFSHTTNIQKHIDDLSILLTPKGQAKVWYEVDKENKILAIYSSTPTNISYRLTAPRYDSDNWKNTRTSINDPIGMVINNSNIYENQNSIFDNPVISPELIAKIDGTYSLKINGTENKEVSSFMNSIIANLKAGIAVVSNLVADNLTIQTKLISPLADIDQLKVIDATISGTLYAENIKGQTIDNLHSQINLLNEKYSTASAILADLQARYSTYDSLQTASNSASLIEDPLALSPLATTSASIPQDLALNSLFVETDIFAHSFSSFDTDLFIQPTGDHPVHLLANLMTLFPDGKVLINGDFLITGTLFAQGIDTQTATVSGTLAVGSSTIASNSARFAELTTDGLIIASGNDYQATISGQTNSNATIGTAIILSGTNEISITNNKITPSTLIYITPTSDTGGRVLFVKSKTANLGFTVGITGDTNTPNISFNYWLVETK